MILFVFFFIVLISYFYHVSRDEPLQYTMNTNLF